MKRTVFKYPISLFDFQAIRMPEGAQILTVAVQNGTLNIWALVEPAKPETWRVIRIAGTGHPITEHPHTYISTVQMLMGNLVYHIFEVIIEPHHEFIRNQKQIG